MKINLAYYTNTKRIFHILLLIVIVSMPTFLWSQLSIAPLNFPDLPYTLPNNPIGIHTLHISNHIRKLKEGQTTLKMITSAGNVWIPDLAIYIPTNLEPDLEEKLKELPFHERLPMFKQRNFERDTLSYAADGVIRNVRMELKHQLNSRQQVGIVLNTHLLTGGNSALNYPASDEFIEWLHSEVVGSEDPFDRKEFLYNQAKMFFEDEAGNNFVWNNNEFLLSNIEAYLVHQVFENKASRQKLNISGHLWIPTTRMNPYIALGIGVHWGYTHALTTKKAIVFLVSTNYNRQDIVKIRKGVNTINRKNSIGLDGYIGYQKNNTNHSFSIGLQLLNQSSLKLGGSMKKGFETLAFEGLHGKGQPIRWGHQGAVSMYSLLQNWNLITNWQFKKGGVSLYVQEDFWVNNAPDFQYGVGGNWMF